MSRRRLLAATAPLRREPRASWAALRLALYAAAVLGTYLWVRSIDPRPWVAVVLAAGPAVLLAPVALLSAARLTRRRGDQHAASRNPAR